MTYFSHISLAKNIKTDAAEDTAYRKKQRTPQKIRLSVGLAKNIKNET